MRLLLILCVVVILWLIVYQVQNRILLSKRWPPLAPKVQGLTVVGTLNPRDNYDRNLFKILTENSSSRVVLTEYGRNSIFDPRNGPMCSSNVSDIIERALRIKSLAGYAMMEPYLRAAVASETGNPAAFKQITAQTVVDVPTDDLGQHNIKTTLGALIDRFGHTNSDSPEVTAEDNSSGEGSASGRSVEQVITLSALTMIRSLPVVLTEDQFNDAWLEEQPPNFLTPPAWTVHLGMTPEGRSRFYQWSHDHLHESLVFILKGLVMTSGRIGQTLDVNDWGVTNITDRASAQALVDYVKHRSR